MIRWPIFPSKNARPNGRATHDPRKTPPKRAGVSVYMSAANPMIIKTIPMIPQAMAQIFCV